MSKRPLSALSLLILGLIPMGCFLVNASERSASEYADEAKERLAVANALFAEKKYDEAIPEYRFVLWIRPELSLDAYKNLAFIYLSKGNEQDAAKVYKKGAAYMKGDNEFYSSSAKLYRKLNFLEEALIANKRLLELSPGDTEAQREIGEIEKLLLAAPKRGVAPK